MRHRALRPCSQCHDTDGCRSGFSASSDDNLLHDGKSGPAISPAYVDENRLVKMIIGGIEPRMPDKTSEFFDEKITLI